MIPEKSFAGNGKRKNIVKRKVFKGRNPPTQGGSKASSCSASGKTASGRIFYCFQKICLTVFPILAGKEKMMEFFRTYAVFFLSPFPVKTGKTERNDGKKCRK